MEDPQKTSQIDVEESEEFYEKIEAPKFVDFTALDSYRPQHDDRYWFCLRVGCDQKHEEEMDPEEIYKNFVLRVMAARSPNVRFGKSLNGKASSANVKCPRTAPAKSSKSRMSRLAVISSISQKMVEVKVKVKPPISRLNATTNAGTKNATVVKALTTPRNRMRFSNSDLFKSVQNPKSAVVSKPKSKVVVKALVFNSPKNTTKTKVSSELGTPIRKICSGIKKLEITGGKKHVYNKPLPFDSSKRKVGREVKSRVYDSLHAQKCKTKEIKSSRCLERKEKENLQECQISVYPKGVEDDSSDMDIDNQTRVGSIEACSVSGTCKINGRGKKERLETIKSLDLPSSNDSSVEAISEPLRSDMTSLTSIEGNNWGDNSLGFQDLSQEAENSNRESDYVQKLETNAVKGNVTAAMVNDEKENASATNAQGKESETVESDDKENVTASMDKRELNIHNRHPEKKVLGKSTEKATRAMSKISKEGTNSTAKSSHEMKYRKPKPTNPKPFRLRTDERQILKEANLEKKVQSVSPLKEVSFASGISHRRHQRLLQDQPRRIETYCLRTSETQTTAAISNRDVALSQLEKNHYKATQESKRTELSYTRIVKRRKSPSTEHVKIQGAISSRKRINYLVTNGQLGTIKETSPTTLSTKEASKPSECSTVSTNKTSSVPSSESSSRRRRPLTIPKEPYFHTINVPKKCTRKGTLFI